MINLKDAKYYTNRELSWLRFNTRVFDQAKKRESPLLERLKFLAIYGTNLDEFYMIRVAGLKELFKEGVSLTGMDRLTPLEQLKEIRNYLHVELDDLETIFKNIFEGLSKEGVSIKKYSQLNQTLQKKARSYFFESIFPVIIPIAIDSTHPFPHLNNLSFGMVLKILDDEENIKYGLVRIPRVLPRFIEITKGTYVPIESILKNFIADIFPRHSLVSSSAFRVTRNADIEIEEEEADDFMEILEEGLQLRKKGKFVRLEIEKNEDRDLIGFLTKHISIFKDDIYEFDIPINLGTLWQIVGNKDFAHLTAPIYKPKTLPPFHSNEKILTVIEKQDVMLYHPFDSFDPVVKFIQESAKDPKVIAIKMTLYRVGPDSPIVKSLIEASHEGKQVTAMVELKARFDEENNVHWAKTLENAGAHVIYGIQSLKVHAKIALVIKRDKCGKLKQYIHLATGNYNPSTSKIYTDISYFSSDEEIIKDGTKLFHHLTGYAKDAKLDTLFMAPTQIKQTLVKLIEEESKLGKDGYVLAKANSLVDADVTKALYKASMAGTKIDLIIRGICAIKPKVAGVSDNIRVISIIGKYLEHARIYYFKHANPKIYISSADLMTRNLDRRIELMTGITDEDLAQKLYDILQIQLKDNTLAYELNQDGEYSSVERAKDEAKVDCQQFMEDFVENINKKAKTNTKSNSKIEKLATRLLQDS